MADTTFVAGTVVTSDWLNAINDFNYNFSPTNVYAAGSTAAALAAMGEWNVKWFTSVVGDGTTDDTAAIAAIMALKVAAGGGSLFFPRTTNGYLFNGTSAGADGMKNGILIPFVAGNPDPTKGIQLRGEQGTRFKAGSNSMILIRCSRNNVTLKDIVLDGNSKTTVWGLGIVPEDMTSTTVWASQQFIATYDLVIQGFTEGTVIMPGPQVAAADSGCFYMDFYSTVSNLNTRHWYFKKNADWGTHPNRPTRIGLWGCDTLRGNTGYYLEVGSEVELHSCFEELIATGATPLATPTARYITADCSNIRFFGGYSEACSASCTLFANNLISFGYVPASGSLTSWHTYAEAWGDGTDGADNALTITAAGTGGAIGANTSTGRSTKNGKMTTAYVNVAYAKGTVTGPITISGLPFTVDSDWSLASVALSDWSGITFPANTTQLGVRVSGGSLQPVFSFTTGAGVQQLDAADLSANFSLRMVITYRAV